MKEMREGKDVKIRKGQRKGNAVTLVTIRQNRWTFYLSSAVCSSRVSCYISFSFITSRNTRSSPGLWLLSLYYNKL
jgi:hypothetical protein